MDKIYRHQRFIYDLTRKYYLFGRDRLLGDLEARSGSVLEIGCGTGRNLVVASRRYPEAFFQGLDISSAMLETARATFARRGLAGRIRTALGDAAAFDPQTAFGRSHFDRVFFSYTLSMVPDWRAALRQATRCVAPGGRLLIVDFGQMEGYPAPLRRALFAWLRLFHVQPLADLPAALATIAGEEGLMLQCRPLFGGYAIFARLERASIACAAGEVEGGEARLRPSRTDM